VGDQNSSVTRVWPVFDAMIHRDSAGVEWVAGLMRCGSRARDVDHGILADSRPLRPECSRLEKALPGPLRKALGPERVARIRRLRNAYEADLPPSAGFLRWLLEHPERLTWPRDKGGWERTFGTETQERRKRLLAGDPVVRDEALAALARVGAEGSRRKWWAFEGFTSVDCRLETESLLLFIEGKRTEPISDSTDWFPGRNQVIRNLEVARAQSAGRKNFAVLVCAETPIELPEGAWTDSLPHLTPTDIEDLKRHYLGCATWPAIAKELCPGLRLPNNLDDAIELCLTFRA
jgi:hypothetical protein